MLNTFRSGRGSNQDLLRGSKTLYRVAIKAGLYRKAVQVCIIPKHYHRCIGGPKGDSSGTSVPCLSLYIESFTMVLARQSRRLIDELIVYVGTRRPYIVRPSVRQLLLCSSEAVRPILSILHIYIENPLAFSQPLGSVCFRSRTAKSSDVYLK